MEFSIRKYPLITISGFLVVLLYCIFTMVSWAFYPDPFWPTTHYLSRLGNFNYSPFGAYFYNWGCILTGIALIPLFIGLRDWWTDNIVQRIIMILSQILGIASGFALVAIGVFSEDQGAPHMTASSTFFLILFFVLILMIGALFANRSFNRLIGVYGLISTLTSLAMVFTIGGPITEWVSVFGSLAFVGMLSWASLNLKSDSR
jgi:hypothetical membrane protein